MVSAATLFCCDKLKNTKQYPNLSQFCRTRHMVALFGNLGLGSPKKVRISAAYPYPYKSCPF
jgi:hypothetical protein